MNDLVLNRTKHYEKRGNQYTFYQKNDLGVDFVQDKISKSHQGVIRGFHGDNKTWKLITCVHGKIKFVTYDIDTSVKKDYILDSDDSYSKSIVLPPRTLNAHQCLSLSCIFLYKLSEYYTSPDDQWSVYFNDSEINPSWEEGYKPIISDRDLNAKSLKELRNNVLQ